MGARRARICRCGTRHRRGLATTNARATRGRLIRARKSYGHRGDGQCTRSHCCCEPLRGASFCPPDRIRARRRSHEVPPRARPQLGERTPSGPGIYGVYRGGARERFYPPCARSSRVAASRPSLPAVARRLGVYLSADRAPPPRRQPLRRVVASHGEAPQCRMVSGRAPSTGRSAAPTTERIGRAAPRPGSRGR